MNEFKILLLKSSYESDELGNQIPITTETPVIAKVISASASEFWKAGQTGLGADYKAIVWSFEYSGEEKVKYADMLYEVYRTYEVGGKTELYLRKTIGTQRSIADDRY